VKDGYGMPLSQAVKLIYVLCAAGRGVTTKLVCNKTLDVASVPVTYHEMLFLTIGKSYQYSQCDDELC
jgi:hypothetical protein